MGIAASLPDADDHTLAKHAILRGYLNAWLPIIGNSFPKSVLIDGFCGPGKYACGNVGSPIVSLQIAKELQNRIRNNIVFHFNDYNPEYTSTLTQEIERLGVMPPWLKYKIHTEKFEFIIDEILNHYPQSQTIPLFLFIDPFGINVPLRTIRSVLSRRSGEVFIYLHVRGIVTNACHPNISNQQHVERVYGNSEIVDLIRDTPSHLKEDLVLSKYIDIISKYAKYIRYFRMTNTSNNTVYYLLFATNNDRGYVKMKEAMWKVDDSGEFTFSDATNRNQEVLFSRWDESVEVVEALIAQQFSSKNNVQGVTIRNYIELETAYIKKHITEATKRLRNKKILVPQEVKTDGKPYRSGCPDEAIFDFRK